MYDDDADDDDEEEEDDDEEEEEDNHDHLEAGQVSDDDFIELMVDILNITS